MTTYLAVVGMGAEIRALEYEIQRLLREVAG